MSSKEYTSQDIRVLSDREHVRLRTNIYLGSTNITQYEIPILTGATIETQTVEFVPAVFRAVEEIINNSIDEFSQIRTKNKTLTIQADATNGVYTISDNGRGVPIDLHETGRHTPEVVFGTLRSGRNFDDAARVSGVIGMNGVGSSCTCAVSSLFKVKINRNNKCYTQTFENGGDKISVPVITDTDTKSTGTSITFKLDNTVFETTALPECLLANRAIEVAMTNPGTTVVYNNMKYCYKQGMNEVIEQLFEKDAYAKITIEDEAVHGEFYVVFKAHSEEDEKVFTWVNSSLLFDGGKCNTQFVNALCDKVISHLEKDAKKLKTVVSKTDVRKGLMIIGNLKLANPKYDSQAKTRLTSPDLRKEFIAALDAQWKVFSKSASVWLTDVLERAVVRFHTQENKKAIDGHQKTLRKRVAGLLDATSKDRSVCQLIITEGESARASVSEARNPATTGTFALTGKINNVFNSTPAQVLKMGKITDMLSAIGLVPGKRVDRGSLNFGRIVIATDADVDGGDIYTLLVNLFFKFWPELFDKNYQPVIYRLVSPNVVASRGDKRVHFTTRGDYEKVKEKYKGWTIEYMKGLGSLSMKDWEMILATDSAVYIPSVDDGEVAQILNLLFGDDSDARKRWLTTNTEAEAVVAGE